MAWWHEEHIDIAASPEAVFRAVSRLERMGEWSPENEGGSWISGDGSTVGDQFQGSNRLGERSWVGVAEVVRCEPGEAFCFTVGELSNPIAEWGYHLAPSGEGTRLTETWKMTQLPAPLLGASEEQINSRVAVVANGMAKTVANLKASIEAETAKSTTVDSVLSETSA